MLEIKLQLVKTLSFLIVNQNLKKGRGFLLLPFLFFVISCSSYNSSDQGRVTFHNGEKQSSFVFLVNDSFIKENSSSSSDKNHPKMTVAESDLLFSLLKQKKSCLNKSGTPSFRIISRQEKVYDMTFAHLIENSYNAKPLTPRMYFGRCEVESYK